MLNHIEYLTLYAVARCPKSVFSSLSPHLTKKGFGSILKVSLKTGLKYLMVYVNNDRIIPNQTY